MLLHIRQRRGDTVKHAFDVDINRPIPIVDRQAFEWRARHNTGVIDHDIDTPKFLRGCIDQSLHLVTMSDVCRNGECLAAAAAQFICQ